MQKITFLSLVFLGLNSFAAEKPLATGTSELYNSARSYELVIDGATAEKLFFTLDVSERTVTGNDGVTWLNRVGRSIVCGQNQKTLKYSCSLNVDEEGVQ